VLLGPEDKPEPRFSQRIVGPFMSGFPTARARVSGFRTGSVAGRGAAAARLLGASRLVAAAPAGRRAGVEPAGEGHLVGGAAATDRAAEDAPGGGDLAAAGEGVGVAGGDVGLVRLGEG